MNGARPSHRSQLQAIAADAMRSHGLEPTFPGDVLAQVAALDAPHGRAGGPVRDLRDRLWCSIDNDESRDLDQLSVAERISICSVRLLVAIADVDALVLRGTPVDRHAALNTTSVYTPAAVFPMLPERLSTDLTSLNAGVDRLALVIDFIVSADGTLGESDVYLAQVHNKAKLAYHSVNAWLTGTGPLPTAAAAVPGMAEQLKMQDEVAQRMNQVRHAHGALDFDTAEATPAFDGDRLTEMRPEESTRSTQLIENLMIAANGVVARFLDARGFPSIRRMVKTPARWDRIVSLAAGLGATLPAVPDSKALADFMTAQRAARPEGFGELSHAIVKLLGPGQYVVDPPGGEAPGHFGLAVKDYTHSTAPNRRYPDLLTHRLVKAALAGQASPYAIDALDQLAEHCTQQENAANKVERQVRKSATAMLVATRVGERFEGVVSGASDKGTWVKVFTPHIEGKVVKGARGLDVGDRVRVQLVDVDVARGFIDFVVV